MDQTAVTRHRQPASKRWIVNVEMKPDEIEMYCAMFDRKFWVRLCRTVKTRSP